MRFIGRFGSVTDGALNFVVFVDDVFVDTKRLKTLERGMPKTIVEQQIQLLPSCEPVPCEHGWLI